MAGDPGEVRSLLEKKHVVEGPDQRNRFILGFIIHLCIIIPELHYIYICVYIYICIFLPDGLEASDSKVEWSLRARMGPVSQLLVSPGFPWFPSDVGVIGAEDLLPVPDGQRRVTRSDFAERNRFFFPLPSVKVGRKATSVDGGSLA